MIATLRTTSCCLLLSSLTLLPVQASIAESKSEEASGIKIGGLLRLNYSYKDYSDKDYSDKDKDTNGDFSFEMFALKLNGEINDVELKLAYRWYSDFDFIEYAYVGHQVGENGEIHFGLNQVPFGALPYSSNGFWENIYYYMGLEDNNDMGIKYLYEEGPWDFQLAYYNSAELSDGNLNRYSFDVVTVDDNPDTLDVNEEEANRKSNQINFRIANDITENLEVGLSLQASEIYNNTTEDSGDHSAWAAHAVSKFGSWTVKLQGGSYECDLENPTGVADNQVLIGAFGGASYMAADANFYSLAISKSFELKSHRYIDTLSCFNDWSTVIPNETTANVGDHTVQNILGCYVGKAPVYAFVEFISGKNAGFIGGNGIGLQDSQDGEWNSRFNINMRYHF